LNSIAGTAAAPHAAAAEGALEALEASAKAQVEALQTQLVALREGPTQGGSEALALHQQLEAAQRASSEATAALEARKASSKVEALQTKLVALREGPTQGGSEALALHQQLEAAQRASSEATAALEARKASGEPAAAAGVNATLAVQPAAGTAVAAGAPGSAPAVPTPVPEATAGAPPPGSAAPLPPPPMDAGTSAPPSTTAPHPTAPASAASPMPPPPMDAGAPAAPPPAAEGAVASSDPKADPTGPKAPSPSSHHVTVGAMSLVPALTTVADTTQVLEIQPFGLKSQPLLDLTLGLHHLS
jgi:hypothetical protein